jgi:hypothetical protein
MALVQSWILTLLAARVMTRKQGLALTQKSERVEKLQGMTLCCERHAATVRYQAAKHLAVALPGHTS